MLKHLCSLQIFATEAIHGPVLGRGPFVSEGLNVYMMVTHIFIGGILYV